jgi:hypothetical protein
MSTRKIHFFIPTYKPVGGIVKVFDYVQHARALGYEAEVWCEEPKEPGLEVFGIERLSSLDTDPGVEFHDAHGRTLGDDELAFISLPKQYNRAYRNLGARHSPERIVHIIQNVRHVNPEWRGGEGVRMLTRPASRISINDIVADIIAPWLDARGLHRTVPLGHEYQVFERLRSGGLRGADGDRPVRVAYTTWKSDVGDAVARLFRDDPRVEFRAIRTTVGWDSLVELYHWSDVFLATPNPEEGMYLPGLEAMAAGTLLVTTDVGGNMSYSHPGENCLAVGFDDADEYAAALETLLGMPDDEVAKMRQAGYDILPTFSLAHEREGFAAFLDELWPRIVTFEEDLLHP